MRKIAGIDGPLILGPMAGVTDRPMRVLSHEAGAGLVSMEMISANALKHGNKKTAEMIRIDPREHPVSLQIFGPDPETMAYAAEMIEPYPFDVLDINMGCPMPKIVNNGEGCALMKDPALAGRIVGAVRRVTKKPLTVKIRAGWAREAVNAPEVAKAVEAAGADAVAVHGRTREQYYAGDADWSVIRDVAEAVGIPVIGNGDVSSGSDAVRMLKETGCDYVMIARAARGNPWIFTECANAVRAWQAGEKLPPDGLSGRLPAGELCDMILRHAEMAAEDFGEKLAMLRMRKHVSWYLAGRRGAAKWRAAANSISTMEELRSLLLSWAEG